jgi:hypothetical protein
MGGAIAARPADKEELAKDFDAAFVPGETEVLLQSKVKTNGESNKQMYNDSLFAIKRGGCLAAHCPIILIVLLGDFPKTTLNIYAT